MLKFSDHNHASRQAEPSLWIGTSKIKQTVAIRIYSDLIHKETKPIIPKSAYFPPNTAIQIVQMYSLSDTVIKL